MLAVAKASVKDSQGSFADNSTATQFSELYKDTVAATYLLLHCSIRFGLYKLLLHPMYIQLGFG